MILILMILAVYGVTTILTETVGPYNILYKLRRVEWLPFACFYCTAFWVSLLSVFIIRPDLGYDLPIVWLATLGITSFMYQITKVGEQQ